MTTTTAAPCALCGTLAGARLSTENPRPRRSHGLCARCEQAEKRHGTLADWPLAVRPAAAYAESRCAHCGHPFTHHAREARKFCSARCFHHAGNAAHPAPLPAVITPQMLGITPRQIADRCRTAREQLWADEGLAALRGAAWRQAHPEQFDSDHLRTLFGGEPVHAFWREDAAAAA